MPQPKPDGLRVTVSLPGQRLFTTRQTLALDLAPPVTVGDALDAAGVDRTTARVVVVNGAEVAFHQPLRAGDRVDVISRARRPTSVPRELAPRSYLQRLLEETLRFARKGFARVAEISPTKLNFSWITERLAVGGAFHTSDIPRLKQMGVGAVVDCRAEASDDAEALRRHGIEFLHLPAPDAHELTQEAIDRGVEWITDQLRAGRNVYVHCMHGVGRGPLLGACALVAAGHSPTDALAQVKARRWQSSPNEEQLAALFRFAERHVQA